MAAKTRRELVYSVRLLTGEERRLVAGLLGGTVGYFIWLAGTGAAAHEFLEAVVGPVSSSQWSGEARLLAAVYLVLWVLFPSALAVWFVVGELTNIRGNVEKRYRIDRPAALLVAPLALVAVLSLVTFFRGPGLRTLVALGLGSALLLVRAVAYGYRVYALSIPALLKGLLFVAAVVVSLAVASHSAGLAGQDPLVRTVATQYGVHNLVFGEIAVGGDRVLLFPVVGAAAPAIVALTYIWFQVMAGLVVRIRSPDVPRSAIRAGQRYPQVVQPGTQRSLVMGTAPTEEGATAGSGGTPTSPVEGAGTDGVVDGEPTDPDDADDDRFSETRVYSPPEEEEPTTKNELCPVCAVTFEADPDRTHCPNCNAVLNEE